jgi:hypothetical protein
MVIPVPSVLLFLMRSNLLGPLKEAEGGVEKLKGEIAKLKKRLGF